MLVCCLYLSVSLDFLFRPTSFLFSFFLLLIVRNRRSDQQNSSCLRTIWRNCVWKSNGVIFEEINSATYWKNSASSIPWLDLFVLLLLLTRLIFLPLLIQLPILPFMLSHIPFFLSFYSFMKTNDTNDSFVKILFNFFPFLRVFSPSLSHFSHHISRYLFHFTSFCTFSQI